MTTPNNIYYLNESFLSSSWDFFQENPVSPTIYRPFPYLEGPSFFSPADLHPSNQPTCPQSHNQFKTFPNGEDLSYFSTSHPDFTQHISSSQTITESNSPSPLPTTISQEKRTFTVLLKPEPLNSSSELERLANNAAKLDACSHRLLNTQTKSAFSATETDLKNTMMCHYYSCRKRICNYAHTPLQLKPKLVGFGFRSIPCKADIHDKSVISCHFGHKKNKSIKGKLIAPAQIVLRVVSGKDEIKDPEFKYAKNVYVMDESEFESYINEGFIAQTDKYYLFNGNICVKDDCVPPKELWPLFDNK